MCKQIKTYSVWIRTDNITALPSQHFDGWLDVLPNGITIIRDEQDSILYVLSGSYAVEAKDINYH